MDSIFKNIIGLTSARIQDAKTQGFENLSLPDKTLSTAELVSLLNVLAQEYRTNLPTLIRKLDRVSGDIILLDRVFAGEENLEWNEDEDKLLRTNEILLRRWKGEEAVDRRK